MALQNLLLALKPSVRIKARKTWMTCAQITLQHEYNVDIDNVVTANINWINELEELLLQ